MMSFAHNWTPKWFLYRHTGEGSSALPEPVAVESGSHPIPCCAVFTDGSSILHFPASSYL